MSCPCGDEKDAPGTFQGKTPPPVAGGVVRRGDGAQCPRDPALSHPFRRQPISIPAEYAGSRLTLRVYPDKLIVHHDERLVAEHVRRYERGVDVENPDHVRELLEHRKKAREQNLLRAFFRLSPLAEGYYRQLEERRMNPGNTPGKSWR